MTAERAPRQRHRIRDVDAGTSSGFTVHLDNLVFCDSGCFADDFESGDSGRWWVTVGGAP
jgi:hypothetical protein